MAQLAGLVRYPKEKRYITSNAQKVIRFRPVSIPRRATRPPSKTSKAWDVLASGCVCHSEWQKTCPIVSLHCYQWQTARWKTQNRQGPRNQRCVKQRIHTYIHIRPSLHPSIPPSVHPSIHPIQPSTPESIPKVFVGWG